MRIFKRKRAGSNYPQQDKSLHSHKKIHSRKHRLTDFLEGVFEGVVEFLMK